MLFVDDGQHQAGQAQAIFQQGVGADDQVQLARRGGGKHPLLFGRVQTRVEKSRAQVGLRAPGAQGAAVLLGQHGRRGHEQGLPACARGAHAGRGDGLLDGRGQFARPRRQPQHVARAARRSWVLSG